MATLREAQLETLRKKRQDPRVPTTEELTRNREADVQWLREHGVKPGEGAEFKPMNWIDWLRSDPWNAMRALGTRQEENTLELGQALGTPEVARDIAAVLSKSYKGIPVAPEEARRQAVEEFKPGTELTPLQRSATDVPTMIADLITPGPGGEATPLLRGNVFALPAVRIGRRAEMEAAEKLLGLGEKAVEAGDPRVLSEAIRRYAGLGKVAENTRLREAAARYLQKARTTTFKKGTPVGEAARETLMKRGPGGVVGLRRATPEEEMITGNIFRYNPEESGGTVALTEETLASPFATERALGHEMGEALLRETREGKKRPGLLEALEDAARLQTFREPESEQALSIIARRIGGGREDALRYARLFPEKTRQMVRTGQPHGRDVEDWTRERMADLLSQLTSATGQGTLTEAQLRALRGKVGLVVPQP